MGFFYPSHNVYMGGKINIESIKKGKNMICEDESILLTNDVTFKQIFWNKEYPNVLISFINSILKRDNPITSIELGNTEFISESNGKHSIRLDVVGKTSNNEILNIKIQGENDILHKQIVDS